MHHSFYNVHVRKIVIDLYLIWFCHGMVHIASIPCLSSVNLPEFFFLFVHVKGFLGEVILFTWIDIVSDRGCCTVYSQFRYYQISENRIFKVEVIIPQQVGPLNNNICVVCVRVFLLTVSTWDHLNGTISSHYTQSATPASKPVIIMHNLILESA